MEVNALLLHILISIQLLFAFTSSAATVKSGYWFSGGDFPVPDIDSALFTHLFCASADLDPETSRVVINRSNAHSFSTFSATVRRRNPAVKTILSITGDSTDFAEMAARPSSRKSFIDSSISVATSLGFDGLDLSWTHPTSPSQMADFAELVTEWRRAISAAAGKENESPLILTARVLRSPELDLVHYPVQEMAESLDWINVIAYDFYSPASSPQITGPPAALYNPGNRISADSGISSWIESGFPAGKIVMGFPLYGYAWKLSEISDPEERNGFFSPASGTVPEITTSSDGSIAFKEIRKFIVRNRASSSFNSTIGADCSYSDDGGVWIGYDNYLTIVKKVVYGQEKGLLGYFLWQLGMDENWGLSRTAMEAWGGNEEDDDEMKSMKASVRFALSVSWPAGSLIFPENHMYDDDQESGKEL